MTAPDLSTGGTTGISHEHSEAVMIAAEWLGTQPNPPRPAVPALKERFGLSTVEACEAAALSLRWRYGKDAA